MATPLTAEERLREILNLSCKIFQEKVISRNIEEITNEASMQLQLGVILQNVGKLYEWSEKDKFNIEFERKINIESTQKSPKGIARCDIFMKMQTKWGRKPARVGIELKFFPKSKDEATTDNRMAVLKDIENIEQYCTKGEVDYGYEYVYTTNANYANKDTRSSINLGEGEEVKCEKNNEIPLIGRYSFKWQTYTTQTEKGKSTQHCFGLLEVNAKDVLKRKK